ncbi:MAG: hypothetical protein JWQ55_1184, partial [Rhodopila sp.]|nr:hypothetical protein [Rhodopila sp.]
MKDLVLQDMREHGGEEDPGYRAILQRNLEFRSLHCAVRIVELIVRIDVME